MNAGPVGREAATRDIRRGTQRHLAALGLVSVAEMPLPNGRRADLMALAPDGEIWIIEIKSSLEDFRADRKWPEYLAFADRFYFATLPDGPVGAFPSEAGLILADAFDADILRRPERHALNPATRRKLLIGLARLAAGRLLAATDPQARFPDLAEGV